MCTNEKISLSMLSVGISFGLFAFGLGVFIPLVLIISVRLIWCW